jgi:DNA-directed RNA polymerase subunit RPC12/RpoP
MATDTMQMNDDVYEKFVVDNVVCRRRFHLVYEKNAETKTRTEVVCPHCDVRLFYAENHPPVFLSREENLIKTPDRTFSTVLTSCKFKNP